MNLFDFFCIPDSRMDEAMLSTLVKYNDNNQYTLRIDERNYNTIRIILKGSEFKSYIDTLLVYNLLCKSSALMGLYTINSTLLYNDFVNIQSSMMIKIMVIDFCEEIRVQLPSGFYNKSE